MYREAGFGRNYLENIRYGGGLLIIRWLFLFFTGASFGLLAAAGVFTVLTAVGLVPRFAGKTHTARKVFLFEEMVIAGTIVGCLLSVFPEYSQIGAFFQKILPISAKGWDIPGGILQAVLGVFSGMFVGCLALAIAEMLDSIPIFARRISFRHGIGLAILSMALGKLAGSLFYFGKELHEVVLQ